MYSAGSARHSLAVATIVVTIALSCAAPFGIGGGLSLSNTAASAASAASSLLTKLPQLELPKSPVVHTHLKHLLPRPSTTNPPTSSDNKQQQSEEPPQEPSESQPQQPSEPQEQESSKPQEQPPKPTVDERPEGQDPHQSSANASVTTSPKPKLETTTHDRSVINAPLKPCPEGERRDPNRKCSATYRDPESDKSK